MIEQLVATGHAYPAGGDVYFRVASFPDYGKLSGRHGDEEATRNPSEEDEAGELKEDPRDFALWKAHKEGEDTWWESPWGRGRPGWHIECSAMAEAHLGPVFEIHGGGLDLVFPHHENEIAQSRALGHEFAQLWMHNGMLRLAGEKMSKSLGNIVSLREALEEWGRETLLVYFLGGHWRKPIDYSDEVLRAGGGAGRELPQRLPRQPSEARRRLGRVRAPRSTTTSTRPRRSRSCTAGATTSSLRRGLEVFGLESLAEARRPPGELEELARRGVEARARKDFDEGDRLRDEIEAAGWEVRDVDAEPGFQLVPKR